MVDTTLSNSSDSDQTVQAVRLPYSKQFGFLKKPYPKHIDAYKKVKNGE